MLSNLRRAVAPVTRQTVQRATFANQQTRSFLATAVSTKEDVASRLQNFHDQIFGTNWGDYLELVHNVPFWEAELETLSQAVEPYKADPALGEKMQYCLKGLDCMYACEDVRDHTNEILELMTRKTGIMGMGINSGPQISNMDEQCEMLVKQYQVLLEQYPDYKPKIEQSVGHGLAILRMKHKFPHPAGHRFFY